MTTPITTQPYTSVINFTDFTNDITPNTISQTSLNNCLNLCNNLSTCQGIIHNGDPTNLTTITQCRLETNFTNKFPTNVSTDTTNRKSVMIKPSAYTSNGYVQLNNIDFPGHDSSNMSASNLTDCMIKCNNDPKCMGYTIYKSKCLFKTSMSNGYVLSNATSYIKGKSIS